MNSEPKPLPDYLRKGLKLVFVGLNPGLHSAQKGHYYAKPTNHFWRLLHDAEIVPQRLRSEEDARLMSEFDIGLTDLIQHPGDAKELNGEDFTQGLKLLKEKLDENRPRVIAFNGKRAYETFAQNKCVFGMQKERLCGAHVFVLPSTSGANARLHAERRRHFKELGEFLKNRVHSSEFIVLSS